LFQRFAECERITPDTGCGATRLEILERVRENLFQKVLLVAFLP